MKFNLSNYQISELKDLLEYSLDQIDSEIKHSHGEATKTELKKKKDELIKILSKIDSNSGGKAA